MEEIFRYSSFIPVLPECEWQRSVSIVDVRKKAEFILARVLLRLAIGRMLKCAPATILISFESNGRPYLKCGTFDFSISHAGGYVCVAIAGTRKVGVDIEALDLITDEELLSGYLRGKLFSRYCPLPTALGCSSLMSVQSWCMHEAYAKCVNEDILSLLTSQNNISKFNDSALNWSSNISHSIFCKIVGKGQISLAVCVDSPPISIRLLEVDLLDNDWLSCI
ncbi:4'-phosphopantetheinyl transferase family protein [Pseudomonas graminis]|uniref:4'-phosphopantetheinyl transferase family protein n=1 Tax=Pseudomonas graminis TaxID=158627 RepID=UPI0026B43C4E